MIEAHSRYYRQAHQAFFGPPRRWPRSAGPMRWISTGGRSHRCRSSVPSSRDFRATTAFTAPAASSATQCGGQSWTRSPRVPENICVSALGSTALCGTRPWRAMVSNVGAFRRRYRCGAYCVSDQTLSGLGVLAEFLDDLPYTSKVLPGLYRSPMQHILAGWAVTVIISIVALVAAVL
jgi:hypothetical protein